MLPPHLLPLGLEVTRVHTKLIPIGLGLAAVGLFYVLTHGESSKPVVEPGPGPTPSNTDILRQRLGELLTQTVVAPQTVDPANLDALARDLRRAGLTAEAVQIEAAAAELRRPRAAPGGPPASPVNPGDLARAQLDAILSNPAPGRPSARAQAAAILAQHR